MRKLIYADDEHSSTARHSRNRANRNRIATEHFFSRARKWSNHPDGCSEKSTIMTVAMSVTATFAASSARPSCCSLRSHGRAHAANRIKILYASLRCSSVTFGREHGTIAGNRSTNRGINYRQPLSASVTRYGWDSQFVSLA
jgi:hypothetical protein